MGFSKYPNELDDSTTLPPAVDLVTEVKAEAVNRLRDAILAIEMELDAQPSGTFGTVRARLDAMSARISELFTRVIAIEDELGTNPSGTFDTVAERLADFDAQIAALIADFQAQIDALTVALAASREVLTPVISGSEDTNSSTPVAKGAAVLNPVSLGHPAVTFTIEVVLQTTDASFAASFELFNITEGVVVSHPVVTTVSTNATFISVTLTVGGADLPANQNNVLEGRISLASGAAPADRAICKYAAIRSTPA